MVPHNSHLVGQRANVESNLHKTRRAMGLVFGTAEASEPPVASEEDACERDEACGGSRSGTRNRTHRLRAKKQERIAEAAARGGEVLGALPAGVAFCALSEADASAIRGRLGFVPTNLVEVPARDAAGAPRVLRIYPLKRCGAEDEKRKSRRRGFAGRVQPWPTTYWLVDAALSDRLSRLELKGWVGRLERRLRRSDGATIDRADKVHALAGAQRWAQLTDADRALATDRGWEKALRDVGVAGMKHSRAVKCLHACYAFHLGTRDLPGVDGIVGNWSPIGDWIHDLLDRRVDERDDDDDASDGDGDDDAPLGPGAPGPHVLDHDRAGGRDRRWRKKQRNVDGGA